MNDSSITPPKNSSRAQLVLAWSLCLLVGALLFFDLYRVHLDKPQRSSAKTACLELSDQLQAAKERYARQHDISPDDRLTAGQLKEITASSNCQTDDDGHCLCQGGWAIELNPIVNMPFRLIPATLDESDPCEKMITTVHVAVKDYARTHGIPFEATLSVEQMQAISDSLNLRRDESGQFLCPEGQTFEIQPVVIHRPRQNMEMKILMPKPD